MRSLSPLLAGVICALALVAMASSVGAYAFVPLPTAGRDIVVRTDVDIAAPYAIDLDCSPTGRIFAASGSIDANGGTVRLMVSDDDGDTWKVVLTLGDTDGNATTGFFEPSVHAALGASNRVFLAYRVTTLLGTTIRVSRRDLADDLATWSTAIVMSATGVAFSRPDLTSDMRTNGSYRLFVAAEGNDGNGRDIWFTRSLDQGVTWANATTIASISNPLLGHYQRPRLAYGRNGWVHCVYDFVPPFTPSGTRYQRGSNGGASWSSAVTLIDSTVGATVSASSSSGLVHISAFRPGSGRVVLAEMTGDGTGAQFITNWPGTEPADMAQRSGTGGFWITREVGGLVRAMYAQGQGGLDTLGSLAHALQERPHLDGVLDRVVIDDHERLDGQPGMLWVSHHASAPDTLWFNAGWRGAGTFPAHAPGSQGHSWRPPVTPLLLTELDTTPGQEIVWADAAGQIHAVNESGAELPGFPVLVDSIPQINGAIASADMDGDGRNELVAGTAFGAIVVLHADGRMAAGYPLTLEAGSPCFVSIGDLRGEGLPAMVAKCGTSVHVRRFDRSSYAGFPVTSTMGWLANSPVAIGDVDGKGDLEVVATWGPRVTCFRWDGSELWSVLVPAQGFLIPPALAQLDVDPGVEVVLASNQEIYVLEEDGTMRTGWPVTLDGPGFVAGIALARPAGQSLPNIGVSSTRGVASQLQPDGTQLAGWPTGPLVSAFPSMAPIFEVLEESGTASLLVGVEARLHAFWFSGEEQWGYPKPLRMANVSSVATGDVDGDGRTEVVAFAGNYLSVLDTPRPLVRTDPMAVWPMWGSDPRLDFCLSGGAQGVTSADGLAAAAPGPSVRLASGNPSSGPMRFEVDGVDGREVRITVYDLQGRALRVLPAVAVSGGRTRVEWDGRDDSGGPVEPGIYFARLSRSGVPTGATLRLVRLR